MVKLTRSTTLLLILLLANLIMVETIPAAERPKGNKEKKLEKAQEEIRKEREKDETIKKRLELDRHVQQIMQQQQFILEQQRRIEDVLERAKFGTAVAVLSKTSFEPGEQIEVEYVLKNGAAKAFLIDGRKFSPMFTVTDEKGNTVLSLRKEEKHTPPKKEDLIKLEPKETFVPLKAVPFTLSKPGKYTLVGSYELLWPEEEVPHIWFGTLTTLPTRFEIVEKKAKK